MPSLARRSDQRLVTCHPEIQEVVRLAIKNGPDFTVPHLGGAREPFEQEGLVKDGFSKRLDSLHVVGEERELSDAIDLAPWPVIWPDLETQAWAEFLDAIKRFHVLGGYIMGIAASKDIELRWGGDWNRNWIYTDQSFHDLGHFERVL